MTEQIIATLSLIAFLVGFAIFEVADMELGYSISCWSLLPLSAAIMVMLIKDKSN